MMTIPTTKKNEILRALRVAFIACKDAGYRDGAEYLTDAARDLRYNDAEAALYSVECGLEADDHGPEDERFRAAYDLLTELCADRARACAENILAPAAR